MAKRRDLQLLIDADVPIFAACSQGQRLYDWNDDGNPAVAVDDLEDVMDAFESVIHGYMRATKASSYKLCVTDSENFRKAILPTYKANRKVKPVLLKEARRWVVEQLDGVQRPGLEGDDVIGILATKQRKPGDPTPVIVSIDKDLRQIPGLHWHPVSEQWFEVGLEDGQWWHMYQTLVGDPTDNYKGCPGIGPKKAEKLLAQIGNPWAHVCLAFRMAGLEDEDALVQARVAKILQANNYDFKKREPILWLPDA